MYEPYRDIRKRLGEPLWHDKHGVPRYDPFTPRDACEVYDQWVALLEIKCQGCDRRFLVADGYSRMRLWHPYIVEKKEGPVPEMPVFPSSQDPGDFGYGDAPWHEDDRGGCAGATMTTDVVRVVEFWSRDLIEWQRMPQYEFAYRRGEQ